MTIAAATESRFGAAFERLGVERAWTRTRGSASVLIAIVDQGVQVDHPLLGPNIQDDPAHSAAPPGDHEVAGTYAAGIAAGRASDLERFSGVAPEARILPVRFSTGSGPQGFDLANAIEHAVEMGACIVNISRIGDVTPPAVMRAIQYAAARNVLVVRSASGDGDNPAAGAGKDDDALPNQLTVLSVNEQFQPLSNYPARGADIGAPGFARVPHWRRSGYTVLHDAAFGSPYVSGCAALVKSQNPSWGYHELKEHLLASATSSPELEGPCQHGRLLNVAYAVEGPVELAIDVKTLQWSSLADAVITWRLRYRAALCMNVVALYRPHGDEHWRELAFARSGNQQMTIPAASLRRSSGMLRIACRESNFYSDEIALTIR